MNSFMLVAIAGGIVSLLVFLGGVFSISECSLKGYCTTRRVVVSIIMGIIGGLAYLVFLTPML